MKVRRVCPVLIAIALLATISAYTVKAWQDPINQSTNQVRPIETSKETMIKSQLGSLLRSMGVIVGDTPLETADHKRLTVRWQSNTNGANSTQDELQLQHGPGMLTLADVTTRVGAVPRPRNVELATTEVLVIGIDELQQLLWWNQFPDPRILRAEAPDANGQQRIGRTFYHTQTEFTVAFPNNPAIRELRFYHPLWTGKEFQLELIGSVSVK